MIKIGKAVLFTLILICSLASSFHAVAGDSHMQKAVTMAQDAAALIKRIGLEAACAEFETAPDRWHDQELYVFVVDDQGKALSHRTRPHLTGRNLIHLRDVDGTTFIKSFVDVTPGTTAWIDYKWQHPTTEEILLKSSYIVREADYLIGVGIYKRKQSL